MGRTAIQSPNAALGIAAAVAVAGLVAWLAASTLLARPAVREPGRAAVVLAGGALALVVLKLVLDTDALAVGAWASLLLGAVVVLSRIRRAG